METERPLRALFVDVSEARSAALRGALEAAGWSLHVEHASGADQLSAALLHRGWHVAIYAGDGDDAIPTRKALALVRLADPHLPFIAFSTPTEAHDLAGVVKGFERGVLVAPDPESVVRAVVRELRAAERRDDQMSARRLLAAQQAVTDHVAAGLEPAELFDRVLATLGEVLGFTFGAVWTPAAAPADLRCAATWSVAGADAAVSEFARTSRAATLTAGRDLPGRVWAFSRPHWVADVASDPHMSRSAAAARAGLHAAVGFPIAIGDRCLGVIEFFDPAVHEPDADMQSVFSTVGGQLAQYLERRRLQAEQAIRVDAMLRAERHRAQRYLDVAACIICVVDADGRIELINRKGCEVVGRTETELIGHDWVETAVAEEHRDAARAVYRGLVAGELEAIEEFETAIVTAAGERRIVAWHTTLLRDDDDRVVGTLAAGDDVTERRRSEQQASYLAHHDALTGLPNRSLLEEHLKLALARARRGNSGLALLHIGVDNFKLVNDSLGHGAGDELLSRLGVRLQEVVRATDLLARVGGDEFLLLLADLQNEPTLVAERVAGQIVESLAEPVGLRGAEFQVSASIGISTYPRDADNAESLLNHADSAMHQAKEAARGGWALYSRAGGDPLERLSLGARLRRALERNEFLLHYQPIFALDGGVMQGVEALIRWRDPDRGMIAPGDFIPIAEESGLIESIGDWVFRAVCEQQVAWAAKGFHPQISFNVSPRQLRRVDFADRIALHLRETGAVPSRLTLELTESSTLQDPAAAEPILRAMHELGLRIALDDFGSGYSSLSRLRDMPVETLKIDRAFMREVPQNREAAAIVTAILRLSRALGRTTVAEGVETDAQRRFLLAERCQLAQGFLLARPLPPDEVEHLMASAGVAA